MWKIILLHGYNILTLSLQKWLKVCFRCWIQITQLNFLCFFFIFVLISCFVCFHTVTSVLVIQCKFAYSIDVLFVWIFLFSSIILTFSRGDILTISSNHEIHVFIQYMKKKFICSQIIGRKNNFFFLFFYFRLDFFFSCRFQKTAQWMNVIHSGFLRDFKYNLDGVKFSWYLLWKKKML